MMRANTSGFLTVLAALVFGLSACGSITEIPRSEFEPLPDPDSVLTAEGAFFVAPEGSDDNLGTEVAPFATLAQALEVVKPGGTVYLRGGVYSAVDTPASLPFGFENAPITIESYPGERAVFEGGSGSTSAVLTLEVNDYVLRELTFRNGTGRGLELRGERLVVENVSAYGNGADGIHLSGNDHRLSGVLAYDNGANGLSVIGTRGTVQDCRLYRNGDDGLELAGNVLVEGCAAYENLYSGFRIVGGELRRSVAYANATNFSTSGGAALLHNTSWAARENGFHSSSFALFRNNLSADDPAHLLDGESLQEANAWNLGVVPEFLSFDPASPDFLRLDEGSAAIDAGMNVGLPFAGLAPDLGALEAGQRLEGLVMVAER